MTITCRNSFVKRPWFSLWVLLGLCSFVISAPSEVLIAAVSIKERQTSRLSWLPPWIKGTMKTADRCHKVPPRIEFPEIKSPERHSNCAAAPSERSCRRLQSQVEARKKFPGAGSQSSSATGKWHLTATDFPPTTWTRCVVGAGMMRRSLAWLTIHVKDGVSGGIESELFSTLDVKGSANYNYLWL